MCNIMGGLETRWAQWCTAGNVHNVRHLSVNEVFNINNVSNT